MKVFQICSDIVKELIIASVIEKREMSEGNFAMCGKIICVVGDEPKEALYPASFIGWWYVGDYVHVLEEL